MEKNGSELSSTLLLDFVGEVSVAIDADRLSWKAVHSAQIFLYSRQTARSVGLTPHALNGEYAARFLIHKKVRMSQIKGSIMSSCLCVKIQSQTETSCNFSDIYAVESAGWGLINDVERNSGSFLSYRKTQMYRFVVHCFRRSKECSSPWMLSEYIFAHEDMETCQAWVDCLNALTNNNSSRPKSLLVFVHPLCGRGYGLQTWEKVAPIFSRAKVQTKVIVTQRARHAFDTVVSLSDKELAYFDGIVAVGGDGLFNETLNGLLSSRHNAPYPPAPTDFSYTGKRDHNQRSMGTCSKPGRMSFNDINGTCSMPSYRSDDHEPLLSTSQSNALGIPKLTTECGSCNTADADEDKKCSFPNDWFRLGLIPAGSTDAIVLSTTGVRDPVTSALHIILGNKMPVDIAQVVRWKVSPSSVDVPFVRYAASFAGYGFYGDVIKESERCRWMGPIRYDYAGTVAFLKHRSYEAEITFLDAEKPDFSHRQHNVGTQPLEPSQTNPDEIVCRRNCSVCNETRKVAQDPANVAVSLDSEDLRWLQSKGRFLSVGAAVISCRNERAPDGLVANAHLADGFLHLILVKDCSRPFYLWHLTKLAKKGSDPFNFSFVEHHKTSAFTFASSHDEGLWNLDGEMLQACQVSVQVFRGLINIFASGPEV